MAREATWLDGVGGHVALDLVNTVSWRGDDARRHDRLDGPDALAAWTRAMGLREVRDATPRDLAALRDLREAVAAVVQRRAEVTAAPGVVAAPADAAVTLADAARSAVAHARLDLAGGARWTVEVTDARSLHEHLALAALDLLATADPARLHVCGDADCGWLFLDTSRSGTRRWCDPAGCGNRARARRHHARHRSPA